MGWLKKFWASLFFAFFLSLKNELTLAASSLTYYFLLSLFPFILIIAVIYGIFFINNPIYLNNITSIIRELNPDSSFIIDKIMTYTTSISMKDFGIFGFVSMLLTSSIFIKTLIRYFGNIFKLDIIAKNIFALLLPFGIYIILCIMLIIVILLKLTVNFINNFLLFYFSYDFDWIILLINKIIFMPYALIFLFVMLSYYILSMKKLKKLELVCSSLLFIFTVYIFNSFFYTVYKAAFYNLVYGSIGGIILFLIWVYTLILLYLFWGQLGYCISNYRIVSIFAYLTMKLNNNSLLDKIIFYLKNSDLNNIITIDSENIFTKQKLKGSYYLFILSGVLELISDDGIPIYLDKYNLIEIDQLNDTSRISSSNTADIVILDEYELEELIKLSPFMEGIKLSSQEKILY